MTFFLNAIMGLRHPEERPEGASRRTRGNDAMQAKTLLPAPSFCPKPTVIAGALACDMPQRRRVFPSPTRPCRSRSWTRPARMFRRPLLPCALLSVALGVALSVAPGPARSQDRSTQERLHRLERDLNMLQRPGRRARTPPPA